MEQLLYTLQTARDTYSNVLVGILRYGAPIMAVILLFRCLKSLLTFRREPEVWEILLMN